MIVATASCPTGRQALGSFRESAGLAARLDPESPTFRTATLLLTACEVGQSVHKLSLVTGFPVEFVARCARRLVDNGVWQDGTTVSPWVEDDDQEPAFWADVSVAEGRLYRRVNAAGDFEWAAPGEWWKEFHYVVTAGAYATPTRYYAPTLPDAPDDSPHQFLSGRDEDNEVEPFARSEPAPRPSRVAATRPMQSEAVVVGSPALFGNVVWLS